MRRAGTASARSRSGAPRLRCARAVAPSARQLVRAPSVMPDERALHPHCRLRLGQMSRSRRRLEPARQSRTGPRAPCLPRWLAVPQTRVAAEAQQLVQLVGTPRTQAVLPCRLPAARAKRTDSRAPAGVQILQAFPEVTTMNNPDVDLFIQQPKWQTCMSTANLLDTFTYLRCALAAARQHGMQELQPCGWLDDAHA